ncbi:MAG: DegT/DnrJ/EryC1/StrS family aminotransferase [Planctomycetota bacterium]
MGRPTEAPSDTTKVPFLGLAREYEEIGEEAEEAVLTVMRSGSYVLGPDVERFEDECAKQLGVRHAIGVNSGTDALLLAMRALGIGPGDQVITSPFSFLATGSSVRLVGAWPMFADIDPRTYQLDPADVVRRITPATKAIMPVSLFGQPADMDALSAIAREHDLLLLDDAAQSFGARLGSKCVGALADASAFSFYPTKNLGGCGDGGLITTDDDRLAAAVRKLRTHGVAEASEDQPGFNSRLDAIQAAILGVKLGHLPRWNAARRKNAERYDAAFADLEAIHAPGVIRGAYHVYHQYAIRVVRGERDELAKRLEEAGVETRVYYAQPIHRHSLFAAYPVQLPHAERAAQEVLCLPVSPGLTEAGQERCIDVVTRFAREQVS